MTIKPFEEKVMQNNEFLNEKLIIFESVQDLKNY